MDAEIARKAGRPLTQQEELNEFVSRFRGSGSDPTDEELAALSNTDDASKAAMRAQAALNQTRQDIRAGLRTKIEQRALARKNASQQSRDESIEDIPSATKKPLQEGFVEEQVNIREAAQRRAVQLAKPEPIGGIEEGASVNEFLPPPTTAEPAPVEPTQVLNPDDVARVDGKLTSLGERSKQRLIKKVNPNADEVGDLESQEQLNSLEVSADRNIARRQEKATQQAEQVERDSQAAQEQLQEIQEARDEPTDPRFQRPTEEPTDPRFQPPEREEDNVVESEPVEEPESEVSAAEKVGSDAVDDSVEASKDALETFVDATKSAAIADTAADIDPLNLIVQGALGLGSVIGGLFLKARHNTFVQPPDVRQQIGYAYQVGAG